jgi:hypothetical protein
MAWLLVLAGSARVASAQVKLEVTPFLASFYATNYTTFINDQRNERHEAGPAIGVNAEYHITRMWGVDVSAAYIRSGVISRDSSRTLSPPTGGSIVTGSARVTWQPRRTNFYLLGGVGINKRMGEAWDVPGLDHLTAVTGVVGFGIRARVSPTLGFDIRAEGHFYQLDPDGPRDPGTGGFFQNRLQRDVLVSIGVPYALIGR